MSGEPGDHQKGGLFPCLPEPPSSGLSLGLCESRAAAQPTVQLPHGGEGWSSAEKPHSAFPMKCQSKGEPGFMTPHWPAVSQLGNFLLFTLHCGLRDVGN